MPTFQIFEDYNDTFVAVSPMFEAHGDVSKLRIVLVPCPPPKRALPPGYSDRTDAEVMASFDEAISDADRIAAVEAEVAAGHAQFANKEVLSLPDPEPPSRRIEEEDERGDLRQEAYAAGKAAAALTDDEQASILAAEAEAAFGG